MYSSICNVISPRSVPQVDDTIIVFVIIVVTYEKIFWPWTKKGQSDEMSHMNPSLTPAILMQINPEITPVIRSQPKDNSCLPAPPGKP